MSLGSPVESTVGRGDFALAATLIYSTINQYCVQHVLTDGMGEEGGGSLRALVKAIEYGVRGGMTCE